MLRIVNSLLAAACVVLLLLHVLWAAALLAGLIGYTPFISRIGWAFLACVVLHGLLSFYLFLFHDRPAPRFPYPRSNAAAWVQRISGAGMVLFIIPHLNEAYGHVTMSGWFLPHEPTVGRYLLEAGLLVSVVAHLWVSLPRLPLSLGLLRDEGSFRRWQKGLRLGLALTGLTVLMALSKYFLLG